MLEGNEVEGEIGDMGSYVLDVDDKGKLVIGLKIEKDMGYGKVAAQLSAETDVFKIAEMIAAKTATTWDDEAIKALEKILGINQPIINP